VKPVKSAVFFLLCLIAKQLPAQELDKSFSLSLFTGAINYQGDLQPGSFTFSHSNFAAGLSIRKPLNRWITARAGVNYGTITAADSWNRDYLKPRNLSFTTTIKEAYAGLELTVLDISTKKFTPYIYGGIAVFHFNPWTRDNNGTKTFLQPLSTEGQGLPQYPEQKVYQLTQLAIPFGGGVKYAVSDAFSIGLEFSQRKSFTDYIDDVSTHYVDRDVLLQAKGAKSVELAYRGGQSPVGSPQYPAHGEQRGTPSEMDWYYFFGLTSEIKLNALSNLFRNGKSVASQRCPRF
jgi:opacity protein-like surface antigen